MPVVLATTGSSCIKYKMVRCQVHQELFNDQTVKNKATGITRTVQAGWDRTGEDQVQKGFHLARMSKSTGKASVNILGLKCKNTQKLITK